MDRVYRVPLLDVLCTQLGQWHVLSFGAEKLVVTAKFCYHRSMAMEGTLKSRDGKLYVLYMSDEYSEPFRQYIWWRVLETRGTGYGERPEAGDIATSSGGGEWRTRNPSTHRSTGTVSTGTGSTQAETVERVSIPPPTTGGKELRWRDGRWEKLMAKGWVSAGEGKAKTSKKPSTKHATAKRHHATKKSRALSKTHKEIRRASVTTDYFRGQTYGDVEWEDGSVTSGPLNTHMRALLERARGEGKNVRHKTIGA